MSRTCGECQACCEVLSVTSEPGDPVVLQKPGNTPCPHQCESGCGIYAQRPRPCSAYECAWRSGHGEDNERPDRCGAIWDYSKERGGDLVIVMGGPAPGFAYHSRSYRNSAKAWAARGAAVVYLVARNRVKILATPEQRRKMANAVIRMGDGVLLDLGAAMRTGGHV